MNESTPQPTPSSDRRPFRVVVGVDGSSDSVAALRAGEWAAAARGGHLAAVTAWGVPTLMPRVPAMVPDLRGAAFAVQHDAVVEAFHGACLVQVDTVVELGGAASVLIEASRDADLLVVGSRGHGGFTGLLIGSVSMAVAVRAACPVLVVHTGDELAANGGTRPARVLVGVGSDPSSVGVLRAAAAAATEMDAELLVIESWDDQLTVDSYVDFREELRTATQESLDRTIAEAFPDGRPARLQAELREGPASRTLVRGSEHADLVVIGRGGLGELAGVLVGAVALPVVEHASCPVLVVPDVRRSGRGSRAGSPLAAGVA